MLGAESGFWGGQQFNYRIPMLRPPIAKLRSNHFMVQMVFCFLRGSPRHPTTCFGWPYRLGSI
jgi:hypothetical protein